MTPAKRASAARGSAPDYLAKSEEFLGAARRALEDDASDAAMLNAIHAGISAADAVCVALAGTRSTDPDHARAVDLLEEVGRGAPEFRDKAKQLRQLVTKKSVVEYEARRARAAEARDSVRRAERLAMWARTQVVAALGR